MGKIFEVKKSIMREDNSVKLIVETKGTVASEADFELDFPNRYRREDRFYS